VTRRHAATRSRRDSVVGWWLIVAGLAVAAAGLTCLATYRAAGDGTWLSSTLHFAGFASAAGASALWGAGVRTLRQRDEGRPPDDR
jgi:hypothetical protein